MMPGKTGVNDKATYNIRPTAGFQSNFSQKPAMTPPNT